MFNLIQVGLGGHGEYVGAEFVMPSADFRYAGIADVIPERLKTCGIRCGVPEERRFSDYRRAFAELEADAVLIEAVSAEHYAIALEALQQGLHVLVEKPFTLHVEEAKRLVAEAARRNLVLMVNQNYRYYRTVQTLKSTLHSGGLGKPLIVQAEFYCHHEGRPYQQQMDDVLLFEMSVHHIDMMRYLFNAELHYVRANGWKTPGTAYQGNDNLHASYVMTPGIPVFYTASFAGKGKVTAWEGNWRIQCEEGSLHLDAMAGDYGVYAVPHGKEPRQIPLPAQEGEGIHGILAEFADAIRDGRKPAVSGEDNIHTLASLAATAASSRDGMRRFAADYL